MRSTRARSACAARAALPSSPAWIMVLTTTIRRLRFMAHENARIDPAAQTGASLHFVGAAVEPSHSAPAGRVSRLQLPSMQTRSPFQQAWAGFWTLKKHRQEPLWAQLAVGASLALPI